MYCDNCRFYNKETTRCHSNNRLQAKLDIIAYEYLNEGTLDDIKSYVFDKDSCEHKVVKR